VISSIPIIRTELHVSAIYHISFKLLIFTDIIFFKRADPFHWICLFCIFVRNTIYVIGIDQPWVVFMVSDLQLTTPIIFIDLSLTEQKGIQIYRQVKNLL